jgi:hypothetical protein
MKKKTIVFDLETGGIDPPTDDEIRFLLAAEGYIFPTTEAEMDAFEENFKDYIPKVEVPEGYTADKILKEYYEKQNRKKRGS